VLYLHNIKALWNAVRSYVPRNVVRLRSSATPVFPQYGHTSFSVHWSRIISEVCAHHAAVKAASVPGPGYPSLAAAILALDWIDFATGPHRLRYLRKSGAIACRTFVLDRLHRWLSHLNLSEMTGTCILLKLTFWRKHNEMDCSRLRGGGLSYSQLVDPSTSFHDRSFSKSNGRQR
jgi:hypothetical protein